MSKKESIHEQSFPGFPKEWKNDFLAKQWDIIRNVRRVMTNALEIERSAKTIGSSLQAHIAVYVSSDIASVLQNIDLAELAITSGATLVIAQSPAGAVTLDDVSDVGVVVNLADGEKCARCWRVLPEVKQTEDETRKHTGICLRCEDAVEQIAA